VDFNLQLLCNDIHRPRLVTLHVSPVYLIIQKSNNAGGETAYQLLHRFGTLSGGTILSSTVDEKLVSPFLGKVHGEVGSASVLDD